MFESKLLYLIHGLWKLVKKVPYFIKNSYMYLIIINNNLGTS